MYKHTKKTSSEVSAEIMADITDKFLACLDKGCVPWKEQWNRTESGFLKSDGKSYSFLNTLMLALGGCTEGEFVTVNGVAERNHTNVKDGSVWAAFKRDENGKVVKGHRVYFYSMVEYTKKDEDGKPRLDENGEPIKGHFPILKASTVWQVGREVDCPLKFAKKAEEHHNNPIADAEKIIVDYQARESMVIDHVNTTPAYSPILDKIHVPPMNSYKNSNAYYSDLFHEIAHSTGHSKRLNRELANRMDKNSYSFEELIAEICSCAIMHDNGFDTPQCDEQSEAYVKGWARALRSDKNMVEKACRAAIKAANYIYTSKK
mgnify:CR=1 FL=1